MILVWRSHRYLSSRAASHAYVLLGVARGCGLSVARKRYLELAKKSHPDSRPGDEDAHREFVKLAEAMTLVEKSERQSHRSKLNKHEGTTTVTVEDPVEFFLKMTSAQKREMAHISGELGAGGPDWGGMWQMAEMMKQHGSQDDPFVLPPSEKKEEKK
mmetsp:Transcript_8248/g.24791  ORF Transcript_8248/g.24791 Transcript_8248/m.24791 type:complete len:158 (+) Transcript_8248:231-704(+)